MGGNIEECLKKFIHHVDGLGREDEPAGDGFWREFRDLRELQQTNKSENKYPAEEGKKEYNIKKNRYKDILPYDSHRVKLKEIEGVEGSDYINASFIEDVNGQRSYIASQGPLPHTVNDFWRMLWEYKVEIVFMVCREEEQGRNKCQRYWTEEGEAKLFGDIEVTLESEEEIFPDFVERKLCARCDDRTHYVKQFHYTGWPDHGVPRHSQEIYKMVGKMREDRRQLQIPIVIHCSAGCGRTGTICAVDYAWTMLDQGKIAHGFSMYEIIRLIRQQRQSMVQTPDQYEFVHLVVQSLCEDWLNKFQEHDYANFDFHTGEESEEVYYNTFGMTNSSSSKEDVTQQAPLNTGSLSDGPKKPQPTPRPTGLPMEVNNNDSKRSGPPRVDYENFETPTKSSDASVSNGTPKVNVIGGPPKGHAPMAPGHSTVIPIGVTVVPKAKVPPSHQPPPPTQSQTDAHKNAVKNMSQPPVHTGQPAQRTVQQTAQLAKGRKGSSSDHPQANSRPTSDEMYGTVVKDPQLGRLSSAPDTSQIQIEMGEKRTDSAARKPTRHKGDIQQNYENIQPMALQKSYENIFPLYVKEKTQTQVPSSPKDAAPKLPDRNYDPEEIGPGPVNPPGTVSAIGGGPPSSPNLQTHVIGTVLPERKERVYAEVKQHPVQAPSSANVSGQKGRGGLIAAFIGGKHQAPAQQPITRPGQHQFRGKNIGFPNHVAKPKGTRQPSKEGFFTRL